MANARKPQPKPKSKSSSTKQTARMKANTEILNKLK
jgi:hypothetical protein